jgi:hypothetical protein
MAVLVRDWDGIGQQAIGYKLVDRSDLRWQLESRAAKCGQRSSFNIPRANHTRPDRGGAQNAGVLVENRDTVLGLYQITKRRV